MANVLLTEKCVRSCPYCFAKKHMDDSDFHTLNWDNLIYIADFLEISNEKKISLLGGEPTLHPDFVDFSTYLLEREFHVNVFTSGIMSDAKLEEANQFLSHVSPDLFSFTCNMNHPQISNTTELARLDRFLELFGHLTTPGFNIYQTPFDINFILQNINKYNLRRHVRIGLTHPIPGEVNKSIATKDLREMAKNFMDYAPLFERLNVTPGFDCGMPLCIFEESELGMLYKVTNGKLSFGCGPAIDIGPDMMVWSCFPLSNYNKKSLYEFNSIQDIIGFYRDLHGKIRVEVGGIYEKCDDCRHLNSGLCSGGCVAHIINGFIDEAPVRPKEVYI